MKLEPKQQKVKKSLNFNEQDYLLGNLRQKLININPTTDKISSCDHSQ